MDGDRNGSAHSLLLSNMNTWGFYVVRNITNRKEWPHSYSFHELHCLTQPTIDKKKEREMHVSVHSLHVVAAPPKCSSAVLFQQIVRWQGSWSSKGNDSYFPVFFYFRRLEDTL